MRRNNRSRVRRLSCGRYLLVFAASLTFLVAGIVQDAVAQYKDLPPKGLPIEQQEIEKLNARIASITSELEHAVAPSPDSASWSPDVAVLIRAVRLAIEQQGFFKKNQVGQAHALLDEASRRISAALRGDRGLALLGFDRNGAEAPQPLVGGFVSRIDRSVQPFGIVVPAGFDPGAVAPSYRMDVWLHGRGDTKTEIPFLSERMSRVGNISPQDTFVLHPFGRHCNAFKFAGEVDVYEAMDHVNSLVSVDPKRVSIRGFSMGGAGCWHFAVHDPTRWLAANPGAGFVDTLVYQGWGQSPPFELTPTAQKLLRWYDVLPWTQNLSMTHTVAYSGEVDKQKQAADRVVAEAKGIGLDFPYVIGQGMGHKIDDPSKQIMDQQIGAWEAKRESNAQQPGDIDFVTYTLRYPSAHWLTITGMKEHWTPARVKATCNREDSALNIETTNVTHLDLDFFESGWPKNRQAIDIQIDGQTYWVKDASDRVGFQCKMFRMNDGTWTLRSETPRSNPETVVRKRPGLQGPIDDAFCSSFLFVLPSRPAKHGRVERWIDREIEYAQQRWREIMRGEVNVVSDQELTDEMIAANNLICFGDLSSNEYLRSIAGDLPLVWTREELRVGKQTFQVSKHVPVMCLPNPRNPDRYVVINSGMTFRKFSNTSNSRQIAMLPDWAVLDVTADDDAIYAGDIVAQGFFNEQWQLPERIR